MKNLYRALLLAFALSPAASMAAYVYESITTANFTQASFLQGYNIDANQALGVTFTLDQKTHITGIRGLRPCGLAVTVRVGVASFARGLDASVETLFQRADKAAYKAKREGGDRVHVDPTRTNPPAPPAPPDVDTNR